MRILLVSHEASRTGAPKVALIAARVMAHAGHEVRVVVRFPGPMVADFADVAHTNVEPFYRLRRRMRQIGFIRTVARLMDTMVALSILLRHRSDLVYINSTASATYLRPARWLRRRVILHVHESGEVAASFLADARALAELTKVTLLACSPSTQRDLCELAGLDLRDVRLLLSVPDEAEVQRRAAEQVSQVKREGELVVGGCGAVEYRKGVDLWLESVRLIRSAPGMEGVRFVWVGQDDLAARDIAPEGVDFIGLQPNPYAYLAQFDVFTLPSRDDPFPLVVLEAMVLGRPIVAFDVGGVRDQIGPAGTVVPAGDSAAFAEAVRRLLANEDDRRMLGEVGRSRAASEFSVASFGDVLVGIVESFDLDGKESD